MNQEKEKILQLAEEMRELKRKALRIKEFGKNREYIIFPQRYIDLFFGDSVRGHRIFKCEKCNKMVDYFALEEWNCDFEKEKYICSECYQKLNN